MAPTLSPTGIVDDNHPFLQRLRLAQLEYAQQCIQGRVPLFTLWRLPVHADIEELTPDVLRKASTILSHARHHALVVHVPVGSSSDGLEDLMATLPEFVRTSGMDVYVQFDFHVHLDGWRYIVHALQASCAAYGCYLSVPVAEHGVSAQAGTKLFIMTEPAPMSPAWARQVKTDSDYGLVMLAAPVGRSR